MLVPFSFVPYLRTGYKISLCQAINYRKPAANSGGGLDFEPQLLAAADKMRRHMDDPVSRPAQHRQFPAGLCIPNLKAGFIIVNPLFNEA